MGQKASHESYTVGALQAWITNHSGTDWGAVVGNEELPFPGDRVRLRSNGEVHMVREVRKNHITLQDVRTCVPISDLEVLEGDESAKLRRHLRSFLAAYAIGCQNRKVAPLSTVVRTVATKISEPQPHPSLDFSMKRLDNVHVSSIFTALMYDRTIVSLDLSRNPFGDGGLRFLTQILGHNQTLRSLDISYNNFSETALDEFLEHLPTYAGIRTLSMNEVKMTRILCLKMPKKLEGNHTLDALHIAGVMDGHRTLVFDAWMDCMMTNENLSEITFVSKDIPMELSPEEVVLHTIILEACERNRIRKGGSAVIEEGDEDAEGFEGSSMSPPSVITDSEGAALHFEEDIEVIEEGDGGDDEDIAEAIRVSLEPLSPTVVTREIESRVAEAYDNEVLEGLTSAFPDVPREAVCFALSVCIDSENGANEAIEMLLTYPNGFEAMSASTPQLEAGPTSPIHRNEGAALDENGRSKEGDGRAERLRALEAMEKQPGDLPRFECSICFDQKKRSEMFALKCVHLFCFDCLRAYANIEIGEANTRRIRCPFTGCDHVLEEFEVEVLVDAAAFEKYHAFLLQSTLEDIPDLRYCPRPACGNAMIGSKDHPLMVCSNPKCLFTFCFECRCEWHGDMTCEQWKQWLQDNDGVDEKFEKWTKRHAKRCPKCGVHIEKNGGCNHITCRKCNHQFCWLCGGDYDRGRHFRRGFSNCRLFT